VPPVPFLLGWTYLANDEKISSIGRYIRGQLAPALQQFTDPDVEVFGWETAHRADLHRRSRKYMQLVVDLTAFGAAPVAAIVVFWSTGPVTTGLFVVSLVEVLAMAALGASIIRYADLETA
jgi:hypothetical protein